MKALTGRLVGLAVIVALVLHGVLLFGGRLAHLGPQSAGASSAPRTARGAIHDLERISRQGLSKEAAASKIEKALHGVFGALAGVEDERARALRQLLDEVHQVRYAPQLGDYSEKVRELAARAGDLVRKWA